MHLVDPLDVRWIVMSFLNCVVPSPQMKVRGFVFGIVNEWVKVLRRLQNVNVFVEVRECFG